MFRKPRQPTQETNPAILAARRAETARYDTYKDKLSEEAKQLAAKRALISQQIGAIVAHAEINDYPGVVLFDRVAGRRKTREIAGWTLDSEACGMGGVSGGYIKTTVLTTEGEVMVGQERRLHTLVDISSLPHKGSENVTAISQQLESVANRIGAPVIE